MELSVLLIHHMVSTKKKKNPTTGPLHKHISPPRRLTSPHRLVILQISAILSLPCPPNLGRSPPNLGKVPYAHSLYLVHLAPQKFYISLCCHLINSSIFCWAANSIKIGYMSFFTHHCIPRARSISMFITGVFGGKTKEWVWRLGVVKA